ncbi:hypothetical protein WMF31_17955 [Sorangium sp. So ce1036]|uniref:hypothetical protein n=1 Tax=Sorangium sp. So ce1036 TaxID=3133328 RepID=UPI003EFCF4B0
MTWERISPGRELLRCLPRRSNACTALNPGSDRSRAGAGPGAARGSLFSCPPASRAASRSTRPEVRIASRSRRRAPRGSRFSRALYEETPARLVWRRDASPGELHPSFAYLDDGGRAVLHTTTWKDHRFVVLDDSGDVLSSVALFGDVIPWDEIDAHARYTTAGVDWTGLSLVTYPSLEGRAHFCLRTFWGRRILIELSTGRVIPAGEGSSALDAVERAFVEDTLRQAAESPMDALTEPRLAPIRAAALVAGSLGVRSAIPALQALEAVEDVSSVMGGGSNPIDLEISRHRLRSIVHLSLRRLGVPPAGYPATCVRLRGTDLRGRVPLPERAARAASLRLGARRLDVLTALGPPDAVPRRTGGRGRFDPWEYDLDGPASRTLRLSWQDKKQPLLEAIESIVPPVWAGDTRDGELARW